MIFKMSLVLANTACGYVLLCLVHGMHVPLPLDRAFQRGCLSSPLFFYGHHLWVALSKRVGGCVTYSHLGILCFSETRHSGDFVYSIIEIRAAIESWHKCLCQEQK